MLLLGATGIATYALTRPATEFEGLGCFEQTDIDGNISVVAPDGRDPLIICAEILAQIPGLAVDGPEDLAACVLESGVAAVFPRTGPETCQSLGLAKLDADYTQRSKRFAELRNALLAAVDFKCLGEAEARAAATRVLDELGFTGWRVDVEASQEAVVRPRAVTMLEEEGEAVRLLMLSGDGHDCDVD
jgi:hypothetical protein